MKRIILLAAFLSCVGLTAQNKIAQHVIELQNSNTNFKTISVLTPTFNTVDANVEKVVEGATLATLNTAKVNEVVAHQDDYIALEIPYQNQTISVLLYKVNLFAEGFHVDTDKSKNISYSKGVHYKGIIDGEPNSVSSFNFFNGEFNGIVSSSALGNVVVAKLDKPNNQQDYIVYSDAKMKISNQFDCHVEDSQLLPKKTTQSTQNTLSNRWVTLYFEVDYDLYQSQGNSTTNTTNWMTSVFNNVQTLYNNEGVSTALKSIYIWTDQDVYEGVGSSSSDYLNAFHEQRPIFDGDLGGLVGVDTGGLGGVASAINGLCSENNYCYSDVDYSFSTVPVYSWTVQVITHEFGHLFGSPHTHACFWNGNATAIDNCAPYALGSNWEGGSCMTTPATIPSTTVKGTIMSYCHLVSGVGISFNNGFGPQPAALILNTVNNSQCLSFDGINTCINTVTDITIDSVSPTTVHFTWADEYNTSWEVAVTPFASTNIVWNTATTNSYSATGLNANTYYKIRIRPLCVNNTIIPANREKIFATNTANVCTGMQFTDTGGTSGSYTNMETWVRTITPYNQGLKLKVTFASFNLEDTYDFLYIYNGPDESYADLTSGGLTGTTIPGPFNSTSSEGSLTFKFVSDQLETRSGWNAIISCTGTLGEESNEFLDYSYSPNPTNGLVAVNSKDAITEIAVYNIQGRLLFNRKMNDTAAYVDISEFATGTYFFKLKFNDKEANFKILKM
ncbi:T9SS type A sorting domain-containing protein [Flavobacterium silvisoli]|uniref:T9SS type A sorting domain-containing protein n=1 Tax=Flavobacterium silvisoli TaxID=2529433 RepID=A0A4Q9Z2Z1_9FLAO|nr:M12 family metallo-peptidase [Flavobacterium silvisoli]TBX70772.1 T9SS type A sorting domain-containing protein [Flavobacterium silvisoli]